MKQLIKYYLVFDQDFLYKFHVHSYYIIKNFNTNNG